MSSPHDAREDEILCDAVEIPHDRRAEFVRERCGTDRHLFDAVMRLLRARERDPAFLEDGIGAYLTLEFGGTERFQRLRRLGSGGYGTVYEVWDREQAKAVALKVPKNPESQELLDFKKEFRSLARHKHKNLVQLYELFEERQQWYFTMELVEGSDFVSHVRRAPGELRPALAQLATVLRHLHQVCRILHRDIKPHNILVSKSGIVKLLDFGLAREVSGVALQTQTLVGTPVYMAPEAMDGKLDQASDWYSLGVVLYEALTGRAPFHGDYGAIRDLKMQSEILPPRAANPEVPEDLSELCAALLARDPAARPGGAEVLQRLACGPAVVLASMPSTTGLIGRDEVLEQLRDAFHRRTATCVHVQGRSGMGKTALCSRFLEEAANAGAVILSGRCYENEMVRYKALDPVVDSLTEYLKRLDHREAAAVLPRERPLRALAHLFPTLLAVKAIDDMRGLIDAGTSRRDLEGQASAALGETLARIAEKGPCVVYIDDLQWGDMGSADALAAILGSPDPPRALFLFSYRSEDLDADHLRKLRAFRSEVIEVNALNEQESAELARSLLGGDSTYEEVVHETGGMPLFIHELAMHAHSGWQRDGAPDRLSLQAMIRKRVALLPEATRALLEVVSVAGKLLDVQAAAQAAGIAGPISKHSLAGADRLIRWKGEAVEPYHDKIREAVVADLSDATRREYYRALAKALETKATADPQIVYQYLVEAGDLGNADAYLDLAADRAEARLNFDLSVRLRKQQLARGRPSAEERTIQMERLARAYALAGWGLAAAEMYHEAAQSAAPDRQHRLIRNAGEQFIRAGNFDKGCALLTALLQRVGYGLPSYRWQAVAMLLRSRCLIYLYERGVIPGRERAASDEEAERLEICRVTSLALALKDPLRSAELQSRYLLRALRLREPYRIANALAMEAGYVAARGGAAQYARASELLRRVREFAEKSNHPNSRTLAVSVGCKVAWLTGRWKESADLGREVNQLATEACTRVAWEAYPSSIFWMCSLACMGLWRELLAELPEAETESEVDGNLLEKASLPVTTFGYVQWLLADKPGRAAKELQAARQRLDEPGFVPHRFGVWYGLVDVALYMGDTAAARQTVEQGWKQLESALVLKLQPVRMFMLHLRARVACAEASVARDWGARRQLLNEARSTARKIRKERTDWGNGVAGLIEASVAALEGRLDAARAALERSEVDCRAAGMEHFAAVAQYRRAQLAGELLEFPWFADQRVENRARLAGMLCPGRWNL